MVYLPTLKNHKKKTTIHVCKYHPRKLTFWTQQVMEADGSDSIFDHVGIKKSPIGPLVLGCPRKLGKRLGSVGYNPNISHLQVIDPKFQQDIQENTIPIHSHQWAQKRNPTNKNLTKAQLLRRKYVVTGRDGRWNPLDLAGTVVTRWEGPMGWWWCFRFEKGSHQGRQIAMQIYVVFSG